MIANGDRKFLPLSLFSWLWQDLPYSFKKKKQKQNKTKKNTHFVGEALFYPKTELMGFP